jgi:hypothetical protein
VPFTHDWGVCNTFTFDVFSIRHRKHTAIPVVRQGTAWSVMGDLNSDCEWAFGFQHGEVFRLRLSFSRVGYRNDMDVV